MDRPLLSNEDRRRIEHMRTCARDAMQIVATAPDSSVRWDMVRTRALINCFTELGEAAARVSAEVRPMLPDLPWRQVVGMRNIIVHMYWGVDLATLIQTTRNELPGLVSSIDSALGP